MRKKNAMKVVSVIYAESVQQRGVDDAPLLADGN